MSTVDSFGSKGKLNVAGTEYEIFRLNSVEGAENLPFSLKVLLENLLRTEDGANITADHVRALAGWDPNAQPDTEIQFTPARVIMQDFTGVPCVVDLATMREAVKELGGDPKRVNPLAPAEMVIDHSVQIDAFGVDAIRTTIVFAGPPEDDIDWADLSPGSTAKFLQRAFRLAQDVTSPVTLSTR